VDPLLIHPVDLPGMIPHSLRPGHHLAHVFHLLLYPPHLLLGGVLGATVGPEP